MHIYTVVHTTPLCTCYASVVIMSPDCEHRAKHQTEKWKIQKNAPLLLWYSARLSVSVPVLHVQADLDVHALLEEAREEQLGQHLQRGLWRQSAAVLGFVFFYLLAALVVLDDTEPRSLAYNPTQFSRQRLLCDPGDPTNVHARIRWKGAATILFTSTAQRSLLPKLFRCMTSCRRKAGNNTNG
jgi:hypothetical protein